MLLKKLSELQGTSGAEKEVRDLLREEITAWVDSISVDKIGNLIATKQGSENTPKILLAAHMDEVALMITEITTDGFLKFRPVGGIDPRVLVSKPIKVSGINGIIGAKAIHLQKVQERQKALKLEQLYIDIGAKSKEEASKHVNLGDYAYFTTEFEAIGQGFFKGKAFDDRVGCYVLTEILKRKFDLNLVAAFTVQEEVGLRGAKVAAYHVQPDLAIVVEGTISADMAHIEEEEWVTELGKGPALSIQDQTTLYNPELIRKIVDIAQKRGIPFQFRRGTSGSNDAGKIHSSRAGIPTLSINVPCRYIHSTVSLVKQEDIDHTIQLLEEILKAIPNDFKF
ncbi:M42 family metallopeptidase [Desulfitobacterium metallireducens]|uniref:Aminopeptidase n=1 Tax=Desulfitobacterium metallireducens DSM 15288 TaxID=871968 RepID=W0ECJ6_9FIRM|nr:M42 family metallopeptidase [Desulfitobacterium metallireducens]AHF06929.1 aminopeptidase [Desulfitobacterium metallireducens DSM 15288]